MNCPRTFVSHDQHATKVQSTTYTQQCTLGIFQTTRQTPGGIL